MYIDLEKSNYICNEIIIMETHFICVWIYIYYNKFFLIFLISLWFITKIFFLSSACKMQR